MFWVDNQRTTVCGSAVKRQAYQQHPARRRHGSGTSRLNGELETRTFPRHDHESASRAVATLPHARHHVNVILNYHTPSRRAVKWAPRYAVFGTIIGCSYLIVSVVFGMVLHGNFWFLSQHLGHFYNAVFDNVYSFPLIWLFKPKTDLVEFNLLVLHGPIWGVSAVGIWHVCWLWRRWDRQRAMDAGRPPDYADNLKEEPARPMPQALIVTAIILAQITVVGIMALECAVL